MNLVPRIVFVCVAFMLVCTFHLTTSFGKARLDEKIDGPVLEAMGENTSVPVLLLGKTQLIDGSAALQTFITNHTGQSRSAIQTEVISRLKKIAADEQAQILQKLGSPPGARSVWLINAVVVTLSPENIRKAAALEEVKYVYHAQQLPPEPGDAGKVTTVLAPSLRPAFSTRGKRINWDLNKIGAAKVWKKLKITGDGVVIAMLDGGVDYTHQDLRSNIWINLKEVPNNGVDDDTNGYVDDMYGFDFGRLKAEVRTPGTAANHGTWTSGIAAGDGSGGTLTGVAPRARLMPLVFGPSVYTAVLAHQYALEQGADVVNMSFSIPDLRNLRGLWRMMADHAMCAGLVLVSGAGNFQQNQPIPVQQRVPEDIPTVLSIGGVDQKLNLASFSSLGPVEWGSVKWYGDFSMPPGLTKPDVVAFPGPGYALIHPSGSGYVDPNTNFMGNSFSSPHGSGVVALMMSAAPELPAWRIQEILKATARDLEAPGKDNRTGHGLIQAFEAVQAALKEGRTR